MSPGQLSYQRYDNLLIRENFGELDHAAKVFLRVPAAELGFQMSPQCSDNLHGPGPKGCRAPERSNACRLKLALTDPSEGGPRRSFSARQTRVDAARSAL